MIGKASAIIPSAALLLAAVASSGGEPTPVLAPTTKWQMDYAPAECRLLRSFGEGQDKVTVQVSRMDPAPYLELTIAGRGIPATTEPVKATISTSTVPSVEGAAQGFASEGTQFQTLRFQPSTSIANALASDAAQGRPTQLGITYRRTYRLALNFGPMKGPLAALDKCVDDLMVTIGLDPAEQKAARSGPQPIGGAASWFSPDDYPPGLNHMFVGGGVVVRLLVGPTGAVTGCAVARSGGDKAFEDLTCRLASKRARFTPAIGASGQPIASLWIQRVLWRPGDPVFIRRS